MNHEDVQSYLPTISVIVPAYNVANYIEQAIDSLINQSVKFLEIIVVNDGSTDSTREKLIKYESNNQIIVIDQINSGPGPTRNVGLKKAVGEYIYFFDSDDILEESFVENMANAIRQDNDLDLIFFSGKSFCDTGCSIEFMPDYSRKQSGRYLDGITAVVEMSNNAEWVIPSACLYLSRREIWNEHKLAFLPILHEDQELFLRLCVKCKNTLIIDAVFFLRRIRKGSIMTSKFKPENAKGILCAIKSTAILCTENKPIRDRYSQFFHSRLMSLCHQYINYCNRAAIRPNILSIFYFFLLIGWYPPLGYFANITKERARNKLNNMKLKYLP